MTEKFPKLMKETNLCIQEDQNILSRINLKRSILRHIVIKLTKEKERTLKAAKGSDFSQKKYISKIKS